MVLGQTATAEKSNEITAIPVLLKTLALEGTTVTIDAMGTQTKIAQTIREKQADYVLCVKDNHPGLLDSIMFAGLDPKGKLTPTSVDEVTVTKNNHGRIETRRCWAYDAVDRLYNGKQWQDLRSFAVIERERTMGDRTSVERAYYISSLPADAARIACPTLLIHGAADPLMPLGAAEALAALIPGAQLAAFAECAHAPFLSRADDFVARARSFLHE